LILEEFFLHKKDVLIKNGTFNKSYGKVSEQKFISDDFFDPQDLVQIKYEMLRTARDSEWNISEIADAFGFSRAAFYKIKASFEQKGISAFIPDKSGPKGAKKFTEGHQRFINNYLTSHPKTSSDELKRILQMERGLEISKRTIERYRKGGHY
jgi:hypothetical protein